MNLLLTENAVSEVKKFMEDYSKYFFTFPHFHFPTFTAA